MKHVLILPFLLGLCCSLHGEEISFETNVKIKKNDQGSFDELKSGDKIKIQSGDVVLALPNQGIPLLIFSPNDSHSQIKVTNANLTTSMAEMIEPQLEKAGNEIIDGLRRADLLIQRRDYAQAAQILSPLKEKYTKISSVLFLDATIHYLLNDKPTAVSDLEKGLQIDPSNEDAKRLLAKLRGES